MKSNVLTSKRNIPTKAFWNFFFTDLVFTQRPVTRNFPTHVRHVRAVCLVSATPFSRLLFTLFDLRPPSVKSPDLIRLFRAICCSLALVRSWGMHFRHPEGWVTRKSATLFLQGSLPVTKGVQKHSRNCWYIFPFRSVSAAKRLMGHFFRFGTILINRRR